MTDKKLQNHHAFHRECVSKGVTLDLLEEGVLVLGELHTAYMFDGTCSRGAHLSISQAQLAEWINTLRFAKENPEVPDSTNGSRSVYIKPNQPQWNNFVQQVVLGLIPESKIAYWKSLSLKKLGDEAAKIGILRGIKNRLALAKLLPRMLALFDRRKSKFWGRSVEELLLSEPIQSTTYWVLPHRDVKQRAISLGVSKPNMAKADLITAIETRENELEYGLEEYQIKYTDMTLVQLKKVAKERRIPNYNLLNCEKLVDAITANDNKRENLKRETRLEDDYVDATILCTSGGKLFKDWRRNVKTGEMLTRLSAKLNIPIGYDLKSRVRKNTEESDGVPKPVTTACLIYSSKGGSTIQHTWVHPQVADLIADWICGRSAPGPSQKVAIDTDSDSDDEILLNPKPKNRRIEDEARGMEPSVSLAPFVGKHVIYIGYIGLGLVKVGYSDNGIVARTRKHGSCESTYPQWLVVAVFEVSGKKVEKETHQYFDEYRVPFQKQKEIYRPASTLAQFVSETADLLKSADVVMQLRRAEAEISRLKEETLQLRLQLLEKV